MVHRRTVDVVVGVGFGAAFLVLAFILMNLGAVTNNSKNPWAQVVLSYTLGTTFGYNLGSAIKRGNGEEVVPGEFLILTCFFATLIAGFVAYAIYSVLTSGSYFVLELVALMVILIMTLSAAVHTDTVAKRNLKPLLNIFSNKSSPALLSGYAATSLSDPYIGVSVAVLAAILTPALPRIGHWLQKKWDKWMGVKSR